MAALWFANQERESQVLATSGALQTTAFKRQDVHQFPTFNHAKFFGRTPKLVTNQRVTYEGTNAPPPIAW